MRLFWLLLLRGNVEDLFILLRRYRLELREFSLRDWRLVVYDILDINYRIIGFKFR